MTRSLNELAHKFARHFDNNGSVRVVDTTKEGELTSVSGDGGGTRVPQATVQFPSGLRLTYFLTELEII